MPERRVVLVIGASAAGKTCLIRRIVDGAFPDPLPRRTIGCDCEAGRRVVGVEEVLKAGGALAQVLPAGGLELEFWEIGGREIREAPRGRRVDGVLVCYDVSDRNSFHRGVHILSRLRLDDHLGAGFDDRSERLPALLCGTKADDASSSASGASAEEVGSFVSSHAMHAAVFVSARSGEGVSEAVHAMVFGILEAEQRTLVAQAAAQERALSPHAHAWSLTRKKPSENGDVLTSPRGIRPHEPLRGSASPGTPLVEVLGQGPLAPRTVARCLERGLAHRAVHVWLCVPRTGAMLLRKWSGDALKHPGLWGPTCHGEVHSYGSEGDGHAAEVSTQAAERVLVEQLGVQAHSNTVGVLEHWFSCRSSDGKCQELVDVYVGAIEGAGLPAVKLGADESVDWVFCGEVFEDRFAGSRLLFHMEDEYRAFMMRRCRAQLVRNDVIHAFGAVI